MTGINLHTEELAVRVHRRGEEGTVYHSDYPGMYAFHDKDGRVVVQAYGDPSGSIPRAVFEPGYASGFEHFGDHIMAQKEMKKAREVRRQERDRQPVLNEEALRRKVDLEAASIAGVTQAMATAASTHKPVVAMSAGEKEKSLADGEKAWAKFKKDATPAEDQPEEKKFLEEVPKSEEPPSTEEESGSDPKMMETPSIKFPTRLPLETQPEELKQRKEAATKLLAVNYLGLVEGPSTEMAGLNEPYVPGALDNRETRRAKARGAHKKAKMVPGASAFAAVVLSLMVCFRHVV